MIDFLIWYFGIGVFVGTIGHLVAMARQQLRNPRYRLTIIGWILDVVIWPVTILFCWFM